MFYTTPLKALSNQKLRDFREEFGAENVGLMTGDLSVNREARVVVMTTEIFRNMLYAEVDEHDDPLADVESVVLDECHYMNDSQRGTVWKNRSFTVHPQSNWWRYPPPLPMRGNSPIGSRRCTVRHVWCSVIFVRFLCSSVFVVRRVSIHF